MMKEYFLVKKKILDLQAELVKWLWLGCALVVPIFLASWVGFQKFKC